MVVMCFFFFNDTATTEIYTLSLHDALPICSSASSRTATSPSTGGSAAGRRRSTSTTPRTYTFTSVRASTAFRTRRSTRDRKSTRLNSSHANISYAVFCLKKKKIKHHHYIHL